MVYKILNINLAMFNFGIHQSLSETGIFPDRKFKGYLFNPINDIADPGKIIFDEYE